VALKDYTIRLKFPIAAHARPPFLAYSNAPLRRRTRYAQKLWIGDFLRDVVYLPFEESNRKADAATRRLRKDTPMHRVHQDEATREQLMLDLDEIARRGARQMLAQALQAEVQAYLQAAEAERDDRGRALVVRNGYASSREVLCGVGTIEVEGS
jgi:Transposase, Mutator family